MTANKTPSGIIIIAFLKSIPWYIYALLAIIFIVVFIKMLNPKINPPDVTAIPYSNAVITDAGQFIDERDGQIYTYITLKDGQKWMTQNLNYETADSWHYKTLTDTTDLKKYGRLYTWAATQNACPLGWRMPSDQDWRTMVKYYGGCDDDYHENGNKTGYKELVLNGQSGFNAQLGGIYFTNDTKFDYIDSYGIYWSNTELNTDNAWLYFFYDFIGEASDALLRDPEPKNWAGSCRCIQ